MSDLRLYIKFTSLVEDSRSVDSTHNPDIIQIPDTFFFRTICYSVIPTCMGLLMTFLGKKPSNEKKGGIEVGFKEWFIQRKRCHLDRPYHELPEYIK